MLQDKESLTRLSFVKASVHKNRLESRGEFEDDAVAGGATEDGASVEIPGKNGAPHFICDLKSPLIWVSPLLSHQLSARNTISRA
jgi:hypothetical protein